MQQRDTKHSEQVVLNSALELIASIGGDTKLPINEVNKKLTTNYGLIGEDIVNEH